MSTPTPMPDFCGWIETPEDKPISNVAKAKKTLIGIDIPRDELALRIAIPCLGMRPPYGMGATEALDQLAASQSDIIQGFRLAADAAVFYFHECVNAAKQPS